MLGAIVPDEDTEVSVDRPSRKLLRRAFKMDEWAATQASLITDGDSTPSIASGDEELQTFKSRGADGAVPRVATADAYNVVAGGES